MSTSPFKKVACLSVCVTCVRSYRYLGPPSSSDSESFGNLIRPVGPSEICRVYLHRAVQYSTGKRHEWDWTGDSSILAIQDSSTTVLVIMCRGYVHVIKSVAVPTLHVALQLVLRAVKVPAKFKQLN
jgi:hypothetical protein